MTIALSTRNPAYATEQEAAEVAAKMAELADAGWTRPDVLVAFGQLEVEGVTDSVVYRAQREKVHTRELPIFKLLFEAVAAGTVKPRVKSRKLKVADVADKAYEAAKVLAGFDVSKLKADEARTLLATLAGILPEPKADEPEADEPNGEGDEPKTDGNDGDAGENGENGDGEGEQPEA